jgi:uroporphyrinogen decarboxylase
LSATPDPTLLPRALRGEAVPRPPVWFMRQAGRYMANYRAIRKEVSFLELCHNPELCAEVTLQPIERFGFDAAIIFSDILLPLEAMGAPLEFGKGMGPRFLDPIRTRAQVEALTELDPERDLPEPMAAIRSFCRQSNVPIIGFCGSPFTLACYLIEGSGSKNWIETKKMMWQQPATFQLLLDKLADSMGAHLQAQAEAGAVTVQLFDTWAGALSGHDMAKWAIPAARRTLAHVTKVPKMYFTRDSGPFLHLLRETGADGFAIDWRTDMGRARETLGSDVVLQGNLDPIALFAPADEIRERVHDIIRAAGPTHHIFNLGHGITPSTPLEGVEAALAAVREWSWT